MQNNFLKKCIYDIIAKGINPLLVGNTGEENKIYALGNNTMWNFNSSDERPTNHQALAS